MFFDPFVVATEGLITSLFAGAGTLPTLMTAASYTSVAAQFHAAAAGVDGSTVLMNESWRGPSSDKAQGAFRVYSSWLRQQGDVAADTAAALTDAATAYSAAAVGMGAVQAWLAEFEARQTLLAAGGPSTTAAMVAMESESMAIFTAAVGVMAAYEVDLGDALTGFPEPVTAQPVVGNSAPDVPGGGSFPLGGNAAPNLSNSLLSHTTTPGMDPSSGTANPAQQSPGTPDQAANPATQPDSPAAPDTPGSTTDPATQAPAGDPGTNDYGSDPGDGGDPSNPVDSQDITTVPGYSSVGLGGFAALSMTRGGVGAISGSATGFRLPANWTGRGGRAFGAVEEARAAQPVAARTAPRGATAPEEQRRRRKDREKKGKTTVIAPGEDLEVPELEPANTGVGVLEYVEESSGEPIDEAAISLSVIERVDDSATLQNVTGDGRRDRI